MYYSLSFSLVNADLTWFWHVNKEDSCLMIQTSFERDCPRLINEEFSVWRVWRHRLDFIVERWVWCPCLVSVIGHDRQEMGACWEKFRLFKNKQKSVFKRQRRQQKLLIIIIFLPCVFSSSVLISYRSLWKRGGLSLMSRMEISTPNLVSIDESVFLASNFSYRSKGLTQS